MDIDDLPLIRPKLLSFLTQNESAAALAKPIQEVTMPLLEVIQCQISPIKFTGVRVNGGLRDLLPLRTDTSGNGGHDASFRR